MNDDRVWARFGSAQQAWLIDSHKTHIHANLHVPEDAFELDLLSDSMTAKVSLDRASAIHLRDALTQLIDYRATPSEPKFEETE